MLYKNTSERYGYVAMLFHWIMALIIIGLLGLGLYMTELPLGPDKFKMYGWHKEYGLVILGLAVLRISWRLSQSVPALPSGAPRWQNIAARLVHFAFYVFMIAMPLSGWMMSSAAGFPPSFFGLFVLPDLVAPNELLRGTLGEIHKWLGYGLIAAIGAHVGAVIQHYVFYKDNILKRMLP